jgi:hypothetical protein
LSAAPTALGSSGLIPTPAESHPSAQDPNSWTGVQGSPQRTWVEKMGRIPSKFSFHRLHRRRWSKSIRKRSYSTHVRWCEHGAPVQRARPCVLRFSRRPVKGWEPISDDPDRRRPPHPHIDPVTRLSPSIRRSPRCACARRATRGSLLLRYTRSQYGA